MLRRAPLPIMYSCSAILCLGILWITIANSYSRSSWDQFKFFPQPTVLPSPEPSFTYAWVIPPQLEQQRIPLPPALSSNYDSRIEFPVSPVGGYGHPTLNRRHSHEQLTLPNEFLIAPGDAQQRLTPQPFAQDLNKLFMELGVWDDSKVGCQNVDNSPENRRIMQPQPSNIPSHSTMPDLYQHGRTSASIDPTTLIGQNVNKPSRHGGGFGLLFYVPQSASHLPAEQLIHQQLAQHRTLFPFDISMNCKDAVGSACQLGGIPLHAPSSQTIDFNGRNDENVNYASLPLVETVNSNSGNQEQRKWRTLGKRILQNQQQQQQQQNQ